MSRPPPPLNHGPRPNNPPSNFQGGRRQSGTQLPFSQFMNITGFISRALNPSQHPAPPRLRPTMFYYVFTLIYLQNGLTRKFRHLLPCIHNQVYLGIVDVQKRHVYAAGCQCMICPWCEELQFFHTHLNIFQCPVNESCPKVTKKPPRPIEVIIEHNCQDHQQGMPHPNDLNQYSTLPLPLTTPFQFTYHTSVTGDPLLLADALFGPNGDQTTFPTFNQSIHGPIPCCHQNHQPCPPPPYQPPTPPTPTVESPPSTELQNSILARLLEDSPNRFTHTNHGFSAQKRNNGSFVTTPTSNDSVVPLNLIAPPNSPEPTELEVEVEVISENIEDERKDSETRGPSPRGDAQQISSDP